MLWPSGPQIFWQETDHEHVVVCGFDPTASRTAVDSAAFWCCRQTLLHSFHFWTKTSWSHWVLRYCQIRRNLCTGCGDALNNRYPLFRWVRCARPTTGPPSCLQVSPSFPSLGVMRAASAAVPFNGAALIWSTPRVLGVPGSVLRWIGVIITSECAAHIWSFLFSTTLTVNLLWNLRSFWSR